jgi:hypothetical protein
MKQYRIDELRPEDHEKIKAYLNERFGPCHVAGLYWVVQAAHRDCQPFYFAVELKPTALSFELLIRTRNTVRCDCIHYANAEQRERIIRFADAMFETLKILS